MDEKTAVSIFGSCVTRDAFAHIESTFDVSTYIARQSFVSAIDKPIPLPCPIGEIAARNNFERRTLVDDLQKTAFDKLAANPGEYLIIDFIDERFKLGRINGSYFTKSNEYARSGLFSDSETIEYAVTGDSRTGRAICDVPVDERMHEFACRLSALYPSSHIILHAALFVDYYIDRDARDIKKFGDRILRLNEERNEKLSILYGLARKYLPAMGACLDYTLDSCADSAHRWGLDTCHYQPEYYRRVADDISRACRGELPPDSTLAKAATTALNPASRRNLLSTAAHRLRRAVTPISAKRK